MGITGNDCDCQVLYGLREAQFRALSTAGASVPAGDWYATDCPVTASVAPEIEEGAKSDLKCGDVIKNSMKADDQLTGVKVDFAMGCRNPLIEFIIAGSVGTVIYDGSSPPCAIGFCPPTLAEQANARPFEMRLYQSEKSGSSDIGYAETWLYQCLPSFVNTGSAQEEYATQEWSISAVENSNYAAGVDKPVYCWSVLAAIPV